MSFLTSQPRSCLKCLNLYWQSQCGLYMCIKTLSNKQKKRKKSCLTYIGIWKNKKSFIPGAYKNEDHVVLLGGRSRAPSQVFCGQTQAPPVRTTKWRQDTPAPYSVMLTRACSSRMGEHSGRSAPIRVGMPPGGLLLHRFCSAKALHDLLCSAPSLRCMLVPPGSFPETYLPFLKIPVILMIEK